MELNETSIASFAFTTSVVQIMRIIDNTWNENVKFYGSIRRYLASRPWWPIRYDALHCVFKIREMNTLDAAAAAAAAEQHCMPGDNIDERNAR